MTWGRLLCGFGDVMAGARARTFSMVWVARNAAVPLLPILTGTSIGVAWQAHLGGFFAGILLVGVFERKGR
ncbi:Rhomboid family protein [Devosia sp. LC5]|nr:Rhomboid family protein [Devosia sp. LC5]